MYSDGFSFTFFIMMLAFIGGILLGVRGKTAVDEELENLKKRALTLQVARYNPKNGEFEFVKCVKCTTKKEIFGQEN